MLIFNQKYRILWLLISCIALNLYSADSLQTHYTVEIKAHYGNILPHAKDLRKWAYANPYGVQVDFGWFRDATKSWQQCNCYAKIGLSFIWFNLGEPDILGHALNTVFYYEPLLTYKRRLFLSLKAGIGPSYLTKVYDETDNPENEFFFYSHQLFIVYAPKL